METRCIRYIIAAGALALQGACIATETPVPTAGPEVVCRDPRGGLIDALRLVAAGDGTELRSERHGTVARVEAPVSDLSLEPARGSYSGKTLRLGKYFPGRVVVGPGDCGVILRGPGGAALYHLSGARYEMLILDQG